MPTLYLIRHGRAAAGFHEDHDPGLDELGHAQAQAAADALSSLTPMPIISSPLRRCRETSAPLCGLWQTEATINKGVAEIPSPTEDLSARSAWLGKIMPGNWGDTEDWVQQWRNEVVTTLTGMREDTVIFSHFIAINVAVGHANGDDRVVCFRPDNCSITKVDVTGDAIKVLELGAQASTHVG
jgi:broad specificity phosphatase PhoE